MSHVHHDRLSGCCLLLPCKNRRSMSVPFVVQDAGLATYVCSALYWYLTKVLHMQWPRLCRS